MEPGTDTENEDNNEEEEDENEGPFVPFHVPGTFLCRDFQNVVTTNGCVHATQF